VQAVCQVSSTRWRATHAPAHAHRAIPEEAAIAFTYNAGSYAVMMATPQDLEDFAIGFSLTEGLVRSSADILELEIIETELGVEVRMWLSEPAAAALGDRRRRLAGPTGCGLCGIDSLAEAVRPPKVVGEGRRFAPAQVMQALAALTPMQSINHLTHAVHAAGFFVPGHGLVALREDVGRHNALDKLVGALSVGSARAELGMVLLTSRVSIEMVQKAAALGTPVLVAISAPTARAVRMAEAAGITLLAIARQDGFEIFTHPHRILL
jgi:FdhD protein